MDYLKITFSAVDTNQQEVLIALLSGYEVIGFEQKENFLLAYTDTQKLNLEELDDILNDYSFSSEIIPEVNWNEKWERDFDPIILEDKVAIRAHFHNPIPSVKNEIIVTPKMSFGTGHHATTQLMLAQMSKLHFANKRVFDYGTGTGVLSIYAEQLGANSIIANDIDPWSEENAKENVNRNSCKCIDVRLGGLEVVSEQDFDIILANINLGVLRSSMQDLFNKMKQSAATIIVSGVLEQNREDIIEIIKVYTNNYEVFTKDKWLCIVANN